MMNFMVQVFSLSAVLLYAAAALHQFAHAWRDPESAVRNWSVFLGCLAVGLHALALYHGVQPTGGINLEPLPALSLLLCVTVGITLFYSVFRPQVERLLILFQPLAAAAILLTLWRPDSGDVLVRGQVPVFHALLSVAAFSLLSIAGAQVLYILFFHARLKKHRVLGLARLLPSLEAQDRNLFQVLLLGALLLGAVLASGLLLADFPGGRPAVLQNTFPAVALAMLCTLLAGRRLFHWQGAATARWTLGGLGLLLIVLLGGEFLLS